MTCADLNASTAAPANLSRVVLCAIDDVPPGTMRPVRLPGVEPLAVYNLDGDVRVTGDTCSHARAFLTDGDLEGDRVVCPAHWAEFDIRSGAPLCFPATSPVAVYAAHVEGDEIVADLSAPAPGGAQ